MGLAPVARPRTMLRMTERTRRVRVLLLVLVLASIALITIDFRSDGDGPLTKIGDAMASVLGPLQDGIARITRPLGNFFSGFGQVGSLKGRIRALELQSASLELDQGRVLDALRENERLRELLGIRNRLNLKTRAAEVIGRDPSNLEEAIIIDLGTSDGVRKNMPVVTGEGLVGRVISTTSGTAKVLLVSDPGSVIAVRLAVSGEVGRLSGGGRRDMTLDLLNPNAVVTAEDQVVTSGESSIFPSGVVVGTISRVDAAGGNVTRRAFVKAAVDFDALDFVLVVTDPEASSRPDPTPSPSPSPSQAAGSSPSPSPSPSAGASAHASARPTGSAKPSPGASR